MPHHRLRNPAARGILEGQTILDVGRRSNQLPGQLQNRIASLHSYEQTTGIDGTWQKMPGRDPVQFKCNCTCLKSTRCCFSEYTDY